MAKTARSKSQPTAPASDQQDATPRSLPTQEEIARRAYQIHQERGESEGDALGDWLQAERELTEADARSRVVK